MDQDRERAGPEGSSRPSTDFEFTQGARAELRALARLLLGDEHLAEDVVQDAWIVALQQPPRSVADPRRWLRAVVRRTAGDHRRTRRRRAELLKALPLADGDLGDPAADAEAQHARELVLRAVATLREPYKRVIELRFLEDRSIEAIAAELGRPAPTVRSQISRGVAELRAALEREEGGRNRLALALLPLAVGREPSAPFAPLRAARPAVGATPLVLFLASSVALVLGLLWFGARDTDRSEREALAVADARVENPAQARVDAGAVAPATPARAPVEVVEAATTPAVPPPAVVRRLIIDVTNAGGGTPKGISVLVGRVVGRQRDVAAEGSPVVLELFASDLERVDDQDAVHIVVRAADEAESLLATVLLPAPERRVSLSTRGPAHTLALRIEDESGAPVVGARVLVGPSGRAGRTEPEPGLYLTERNIAGRSDALGSCVYEHLTPTKRSVRISHDDFEDLRREIVVGDTQDEVRLVLSRGASVQGRVTRADGTPAAGVSARIEDPFRALLSGLVRSTVTDADGRFSLRGLTRGAAVYVFAHDPAEPTSFAAAIVTPPVSSGAGATSATEVELQLAPHPGITLRIVDDDGRPLAKRRVSINAAEGHPPLTMIEFTGNDGVARFRHVPPVPMDVLVQRSLGDVIAVASGLHAGPDVLELVCVGSSPERGGLFGSVVGSDGQPIAGAQVLGWRDGELFRVDADARDGSFRADGLLPGTFDVYVATPRNGASFLGQQPVAAAARADMGTRRLPAPVSTEFVWRGSPPTESAPWRVQFQPVDKTQSAIDAALLTEAAQPLELLPGTYVIAPTRSAPSDGSGQCLTVPSQIDRFRFEVSAP